MNKALRVPDYLGHILMALERIDRYTDSIDEATFLSNELVDFEIVWKTIRHDFPDLYLLVKSVSNSNADR